MGSMSGPIERMPWRRSWSEQDLIGLQEVTAPQLDDLRQGLVAFGWYGVGRDDGKRGGEHAPIFYRKDRLEAIDEGTFWLSESPEAGRSRRLGCRPAENVHLDDLAGQGFGCLDVGGEHSFRSSWRDGPDRRVASLCFDCSRSEPGNFP